MDSDNLPDNLKISNPQTHYALATLEKWGLPCENIIASQNEISTVAAALPDYIMSLPPEIKQNARYLAKFAIGAGTGLFDYSLNALWDEIVLHLRKQIIAYGLDIFFDMAIGGTQRDFFESEEDLSSIKDIVLIDTCKKMELISGIVYKKLAHILNMRNDIGISHPNNYIINGFELLGWLKTCIDNVLNNGLPPSAIKVKQVIDNLKRSNSPIENDKIQAFATSLSSLSSTHCENILKSLFGIYVSPETNPIARKNISLLVPHVWNNTLDEPKYALGIALEGYKVNFHDEKYNYGNEFFDIVSGNNFRSNNDKVSILDILIDNIWNIHNGWDNFAKEAPIAKQISSFINTQSDILPNISSKLIRVIFACRIGRPYITGNYCDGISPRGRVYYDKIISLLGDKFTTDIIISLCDSGIQARLEEPRRREHAKAILESIKNGSTNERAIECFDYILKNIEKTPKCLFDSKFKRLASPFVEYRAS